MKVPFDELVRSAELLIDALNLRRTYMETSNQSFPSGLAYYLDHHEAPPRGPNKQGSVDYGGAVLKFDSVY